MSCAACHYLRRRGIEPVVWFDTAGSARDLVAKPEPNPAAIAPALAGTLYNLETLEYDIQDEADNFTRFFVIRKTQRVLRGANKTSLVFSVKNVPGALFKALSVFALRDIDLSKIESRPMRGRPWEYVFYVDILRGQDEAARNALRHLGEVAELVKVLGIYPAA